MLSLGGRRGGRDAPPAPRRLQAPLWRSIAVFRFASIGYAATLVVAGRSTYAHPAWAGAALAWMLVWTMTTTSAYADPARRTRWLLTADLGVTAGTLLSSALLQRPASLGHGAMPVTATWVAGPVLAWAVSGGMVGGAVAALVLDVCDITLRHQASLVGAQGSPTLNGSILLLLAGIVVGYVSTLAARAEDALQRATELEAASRERERLARGIHDSVLQVLALVQRRGAEAGGEAAEIGRLAGEQEAALRVLIAGEARPHSPAGEDLCACLSREESGAVSVITPADPVLLPATVARETAAAVRAALDNVRRHCGEEAKAWVLVDDEGAAVSVTVRDDGPGIAPGRLAEAAAEGRLGVSQAICGRVRDLGGAAEIVTAPGAGTEVRLRVPRAGGAR